MNRTELLALYDQDQRIEVEWPDQRREVTDQVVRHISLTGQRSFLAYAWLDADNADAVIRQQMEYFAALGHHFEWKLFDHDQPHDLRDRLAAAGFEVGDPEAIMVFDLEGAAESHDAPDGTVRAITDPAQIHDILSVQQDVWGEDFTRLASELAENLRDQPDQISVYAAYADEKPVCSAWIRYTPHSQFASLWGGSTLPAYRRQGHYTALLNVRMQDARRRGRRFLTVDASPMSRPILEKHGFRVITWARECVWPPSASTEA